MALMDSRCSQSFVIESVWSPQDLQKMEIMIAYGRILHGYGFGNITLIIDHMDTMEANVLAVANQLLGEPIWLGL